MNHNCLLVLTATLFLLFSVTVSLHRRVAAAAQLLFPAPPRTLSIIGSGSETVTHHFPHLKLQKITFSVQKIEVRESFYNAIIERCGALTERTESPPTTRWCRSAFSDSKCRQTEEKTMVELNSQKSCPCLLPQPIRDRSLLSVMMPRPLLTASFN